MVLPLEMVNGVEAYHFVMTARSNSFIDTFYKVRERIDSYTDVGMTHSVLYKKKQREGNYRKDIIVYFDWKKNEARYTNFGKRRKPITISPGAFDPLSVFYYSRLLELNVNGQVESPVTDGKRNVIGRGKIVKREKIKLDSGTYDTYLIEPELKEIRGIFRKSKNAKLQVWVTADHRRIPVKLASKVSVGRFVGELVSASGLK